MEAKIRALLEELPEKKGALIPQLQGVQSELGYISKDSVKAISEALEISESEVFGVATFYSEFRLFKPGDHEVKVCLGTSCYLKGGRELLDRLYRPLGIPPGRTTPDGRFSLETAACLGTRTNASNVVSAFQFVPRNSTLLPAVQGKRWSSAAKD